MTATTVKCASCNIVINELLSFVQNKLEVMDEDSMSKICLTSFSAEENAKDLLFECIPPTSKKKVSRKGEGKSMREIDDIITLMKKTEPECVPIFVAKDLHKLPPITFDHIDSTQLLKELLILKNDVKNIKENFVSRDVIEELRADIDYMKTGSLINNPIARNVNTMRDSCYNGIYNLDSGPVGLETINVNNTLISTPNNEQSCKISTPAEVREVSDRETQRINFASVAKRKPVRTEAPTVVSPSDVIAATKQSAGDGSRAPAQCKPTAAAAAAPRVVNTERYYHKYKAYDEMGWEIAQGKKSYKNRYIGKSGEACTSDKCKFKAADIQCPIYIYNVDKTVQETDIAEYILEKIQVSVKPQLVEMKELKEYNSFKLMVPKHKLSLFFDNTLWPQGIYFRRFFEKRANKLLPDKENQPVSPGTKSKF